MKKVTGNAIILHMRTKNNKHMMYSSRDMECDRHNFFVILGNSLPFSPLLTLKIKIWKKCKNPGDIILLHMFTINEDHMMYGS